MFNQFYSLSSRFSAICFALVLLLLAQPVAACVGNSNVQIQCENGHEDRLFLDNVDALSRLQLPEECQVAQQTEQNFASALPNVVARVAETQWVNVSIFVGNGVVVPDYDLGDCYLRETTTVEDVVIKYEHARPYCVGQTDFCYTSWSTSYVRKVLAEASAGSIGNLSIVMLVAMIGIGVGAKVGQNNYQLGRFFTKELAYGLLGLFGVYALVILAAYFSSWVRIFEIGFLMPAMMLGFGVPKLFQATSFGIFCLMTAVYLFMLVFMAMQIKLKFKRKESQQSV